MVYIREAHPDDSNWGDGSGVVDPTSLTERRTVAKTCAAKLDLSIPTVVDDMEDTVNQAYKAWPERIYVIDTDKRIAYKSGIGPFGFKPWEAEKVLRKLVK